MPILAGPVVGPKPNEPSTEGGPRTFFSGNTPIHRNYETSVHTVLRLEREDQCSSRRKFSHKKQAIKDRDMKRGPLPPSSRSTDVETKPFHPKVRNTRYESSQ